MSLICRWKDNSKTMTILTFLLCITSGALFVLPETVDLSILEKVVESLLPRSPSSSCHTEYNPTTRFFYRTYCSLASVPSNIPAEALEVDLYHNAITTIPGGSFSHLTQCTVLSLQHNHISSVNSDVFRGMGSLVHLHLEYNRISIIQSGTFGTLPACTNL